MILIIFLALCFGLKGKLSFSIAPVLTEINAGSVPPPVSQRTWIMAFLTVSNEHGIKNLRFPKVVRGNNRHQADFNDTLIIAYSTVIFKKNSAVKSLTCYFKITLHKDCNEDAQSDFLADRIEILQAYRSDPLCKMSENMQKYPVQSHNVDFVRRCLKRT